MKKSELGTFVSVVEKVMVETSIWMKKKLVKRVKKTRRERPVEALKQSEITCSLKFVALSFSYLFPLD